MPTWACDFDAAVSTAHEDATRTLQRAELQPLAICALASSGVVRIVELVPSRVVEMLRAIEHRSGVATLFPEERAVRGAWRRDGVVLDLYFSLDEVASCELPVEDMLQTRLAASLA